MPFVLRITAVVLLALSLGLHWGVVQSVAWAGMLAERFQTASLGEALRTTFDGQHPCRLCLVVREGKATSQRDQELPNTTGLKLELTLAGAVPALVRVDPDGCELRGAPAAGLRSWIEPPDLPPPRRV